MIVANKKYLEKEEEVYPDTETFFNKKNQYYQKCGVYGVYTAYEALQKECADIAELFKNRYPGNNCYYDVSKIGDGMYIVEETSGKNKYYYPYVSDKTVVKGSCCYLDYDSAVLAVVAMKYMNTKSATKVGDMVMVLEKLIDKPMEEQ